MPTKEEKVSKVKQDAKRAKNSKYKKLIKKQFKKNEVYLKEKKLDEKELEKLISETQRILDKAKSKKVIHANKAAHKKSQWSKRLSPSRGEKKVANREEFS